jgi:hypothetical protein
MIPQSLVRIYPCFEEMTCLQLQGWRVSQASMQASSHNLLPAWLTLEPWRWEQYISLNVGKLHQGIQCHIPQDSLIQLPP